MPISNQDVELTLANPDGEIRLAAISGKAIVGIGALILRSCELRACYVAPHAARGGVGRALVEEIEQISRRHRLAYLELDSSITAEPFYARLGYKVIEYGSHAFPTCLMACVKMRKAVDQLDANISTWGNRASPRRQSHNSS